MKNSNDSGIKMHRDTRNVENTNDFENLRY